MHDHSIEFGTDGIRGVAGQHPLNPETVLAIGRAIGAWLAGQHTKPSVILGRDTRPSGPHLTHALMAGLTAEGIMADDLDVITTPGVAYLTRSLGYSLGIVISASHNPAAQNGIKIIGADGFKLSDEAEAEIAALIVNKLEHPGQTQHFGQARSVSQYRKLYLQHLLNDHPLQALEGLHIVLDCANGAAYELGPAAFAQLGATITATGASPTGDNINVNSGSEVVRRQRQALLTTMRANNADLGVAFDGDADRVIFLTPQGTLIDGDHVLGLLAVHLKASGELPGNAVVATDMSNSGLEHYLSKHGIGLERTKVGDRYVMERLRERSYRLGGEQAGHVIVLDDEHTAGDGLHIGLMVAALMAKNKGVLDQLAADAPRVPQLIASAHLERRVPLEDVSQLQPYIDETLAAFRQQGRVNVRFSGTEPNLLRVMVEGGVETSQQEVIERVMGLCKMVAEASRSTDPHIDIVDCATGEKVEVPA